MCILQSYSYKDTPWFIDTAMSETALAAERPELTKHDFQVLLFEDFEVKLKRCSECCWVIVFSKSVSSAFTASHKRAAKVNKR